VKEGGGVYVALPAASWFLGTAISAFHSASAYLPSQVFTYKTTQMLSRLVVSAKPRALARQLRQHLLYKCRELGAVCSWALDRGQIGLSARFHLGINGRQKGGFSSALSSRAIGAKMTPQHLTNRP
jgi:hypothetical protein